jgi:hypothetical protein
VLEQAVDVAVAEDLRALEQHVGGIGRGEESVAAVVHHQSVELEVRAVLDVDRRGRVGKTVDHARAAQLEPLDVHVLRALADRDQPARMGVGSLGRVGAVDDRQLAGIARHPDHADGIALGT